MKLVLGPLMVSNDHLCGRGSCAAHHSGLLSFSVNEENMMLKLMLILSASLALASTECCRMPALRRLEVLMVECRNLARSLESK
jgi:hypothetical protein